MPRTMPRQPSAPSGSSGCRIWDPWRAVMRPSHGDDDLCSDVSFAHVPQRLGQLVQRVLSVDDRCRLAGLEELSQDPEVFAVVAAAMISATAAEKDGQAHKPVRQPRCVDIETQPTSGVHVPGGRAAWTRGRWWEPDEPDRTWPVTGRFRVRVPAPALAPTSSVRRIQQPAP